MKRICHLPSVASPWLFYCRCYCHCHHHCHCNYPWHCHCLYHPLLSALSITKNVMAWICYLPSVPSPSCATFDPTLSSRFSPDNTWNFSQIFPVGGTYSTAVFCSILLVIGCTLFLSQLSPDDTQILSDFPCHRHCSILLVYWTHTLEPVVPR